MARDLVAGEEPIRVARQHWAVFVTTLLVCVAVVAVGAGVAIALPSDAGGRSLHDLRLAIGLAAALLAAVILTLRWLRWHYTTFTLTTRRVIVSLGVLARSTESISLDRIQDTVVRQSLLGRIVGAGNVEIESAGRDGSEMLRLIADPVDFSNRLQAAVEAHRSGVPYGGAPAAPGGAPAWGQGYAPPGDVPAPPAGYGPPPGYGPPRDRGGL